MKTPQTIQVRDVLSFLNRFAPPTLAEVWDNVGLQVGSLGQNVKGVLVALDITEEVIRESVTRKANLIITHHPLFFKKVDRLDDSTLPMRLAKQAVENRLNILSFHTNLDSTEHGLNDLLANQLGLKKIKVLMRAQDPKKINSGLGRVGQWKKSSLLELVAHTAKTLKIKNLRFVGNPQQKIETIAIITGSGADYFLEAKRAGAQVLITGDVKYHTALEAESEGVALIDVGHFASEIGMVSLISNQLKDWMKRKRISLPIFETKVQRDPFQFFYTLKKQFPESLNSDVL